MDQLNEGVPFLHRPQLRFPVYAIVALLLVVFSVLWLKLIAIGGVTPDLLLILCVWVAISEGQYAGMLFAFAVGMIFDITSADVLGSNGLAKTVAAFVAGYFYIEAKSDRTLGSARFLAIVTISAIIHNLLYYFLYIRPSEISFWGFFLKYGLAATLYTTVIAVIPMLWKSRDMER